MSQWKQYPMEKLKHDIHRVARELFYYEMTSKLQVLQDLLKARLDPNLPQEKAQLIIAGWFQTESNDCLTYTKLY